MTTIVIEDGTFPAAANSYVTEQEALDYHAARGNSSWKAASSKERSEALVRAADGLEMAYAGKWVGVKTQSWTDGSGNPATPVQVFAFPRVETSHETDPVLLRDGDGIQIAADAIPVAVKNAQMEVALIELTQRFVGNEVSADQAIKKQKVDSIEVEFHDFAPMVDKFPHIDMILSGLVPVSGASGGMDVVIGLTTEEISQNSSASLLDYPDYYIQG